MLFFPDVRFTLGVSLPGDLNWKPRILNITNKANLTLALSRGACIIAYRWLMIRPTNRYISTLHNKNLHEGGGMHNQCSKAT